MKPILKRDLHWVRLDNAAKIYPAARTRHWSNMFRLSVTLTEAVDTALLQQALDATVPRFPTIAARLRRGIFWYYLQQLQQAPPVSQEQSYPLAFMHPQEARQCAFRVIVYQNRIAVEFFHSLTDGTGGLTFLKSLVAEYLQRKYAVTIPATHGILDRGEPPRQEEMEDSFPKHAASVTISRSQPDSWHYYGTAEPDHRQHLIRFQLSVRQTLDKAHEYGVSLTEFLAAVLMQAILELQAQTVSSPHRRKAVRLMVPVNLRRLFPSKTLRNFSLYVIPEVDPRLGHYDFRELCTIVRLKMATEVTQKQMAQAIAANVRSEQLMAVRVIPLPLKNLIMKAVFQAVGERKSFMSLSNLGAVSLPEEMRRYVTGWDLILGPQASAPHNCGVLSYGDDLILNFIRNIKEPALEAHCFRILQDLGLGVTVQSNREE